MNYEYSKGLDLRDYFAGIIVAALIHVRQHRMPEITADEIAVEAYDIADALLEARSAE